MKSKLDTLGARDDVCSMVCPSNYCIRFIDMPCKIKGTTVEDGNGYYNIYINNRISEEGQRKAILHELQHILRDDFDNSASLDEIEEYRHEHAV